MFVTNWISTTKIQKISEITNFFRHYFLSRTEVFLLLSTCNRLFQVVLVSFYPHISTFLIVTPLPESSSPFLGFDKFGCKGNVCTHIPCKVSAYGLLLKSPPYRSYLSREPCWKSTDTFRGNKILINPEIADAKLGNKKMKTYGKHL